MYISGEQLEKSMAELGSISTQFFITVLRFVRLALIEPAFVEISPEYGELEKVPKGVQGVCGVILPSSHYPAVVSSLVAGAG